MTVTALLVSHDGARWLPAVLQGLITQTRPVDQFVAVDTGSKDESVDLIGAALGPATVINAPREASFPRAVEVGLENAGDAEWIWLLHDDANPEPDALEQLLAAAEAHPEADLFGPKLREWPSLRRLLELGVTISSTGRRETGLERGEYDQGQHDVVRAVLAVNTAGLLIRRRVLTQLGGLDPHLPIFGNDIDLGWRAAEAGFTTMIVPPAVMFHAEAAHRGTRRTPLTGRHTHYQERRAALYTLLANGSGRALPFQVVRLTLGSLLRVIGFLLVRSVGEALDELAALVSLYASPRLLLQARRERAAHRAARAPDAPPAKTPGLLAAWWVPYRHGLDFVTDVLAAVTLQAQDVAERRRAAKLVAEGGPARTVLDEEEELAEDTGLVARFVTNPLALIVAAFVVLALIGARSAFGDVSGGALSPAPGSVADWWRLHTEVWHPLLNGTQVPAPAYVAPLAVLGTLLGGSAPAAVSAILVAAIPVALAGAWRFLRVAGRFLSAEGTSRWVVAWGAATYALVPATSGAWGDGRLGTVVCAALLPWLAHAALGFADPEPDRRWRAAWRTGLLLAVIVAFAPLTWPIALLIALLALGVGVWASPSGVRQRSVLGPPLTALLIAPALLVPWLLPMLRSRASGLLLEVGRLPAPSLDWQDLVAGHAAAQGAPRELGIALAVVALAALIPERSRVMVVVCWLVALVAAVVGAVTSRLMIDLAAQPAWPGQGVVAVVLSAAWICALVLAAPQAWRMAPLAGRRIVGGLGIAALTVIPAVGLGWFVSGESSSLSSSPDSLVPAYMLQSSELGPAHGILVIEGTTQAGLTFAVRRGDGPTLGEDEIVALTDIDQVFAEDVQALVSRPTAAIVNGLADQGIEYVLLPAPADPQAAATLDATAGLTQASTEDRSTRAWKVDKELDPDAVRSATSTNRWLLVGWQAIAVLVTVVMCGPTRRERT